MYDLYGQSPTRRNAASTVRKASQKAVAKLLHRPATLASIMRATRAAEARPRGDSVVSALSSRDSSTRLSDSGRRPLRDSTSSDAGGFRSRCSSASSMGTAGLHNVRGGGAAWDDGGDDDIEWGSR